MAGPPRSSPGERARASYPLRLRPLLRRLPPVAIRPKLPPPPPLSVPSSDAPPPMAHLLGSRSRDPLLLQPLRGPVLCGHPPFTLFSLISSPSLTDGSLATNQVASFSGIQSPVARLCSLGGPISAALSNPAVSPQSHLHHITLVSIITYSTVFLLRWLDSGWIKLELPSDTKSLKKALSIGGKHYRIFSDRSRSLELYSYDLLVVDAFSTPPSTRYFEMMGWSEMAEESGRRHGATHLVEFDGEPSLVKEIVTLDKYVDDRKTTVGFELFRADLDRKVWVKVESIGDDRVLLLHWFQYVSLLAADTGARGNCICFSTGLKLEGDMEGAPWKVFDLGTGRVTDFLLPNASRIEKSHQRLLVPTLR